MTTEKILAKVLVKRGVPHIFQGETVELLDCEEIDCEFDLFSYWVKLEYYDGRIYHTWINSEDLELM